MQNKTQFPTRFSVLALLTLFISAGNVRAQLAQPAAQAEVAPVLRYRDPATPLTIGEMSALQAEKLETDFYKKLGYTTSTPGPTPTDIARKSQKKPVDVVTALGIYGPVSSPQADITVNGRLVAVRGGEHLAGGLTVLSVTPSGLQLTRPSKKRGVITTFSLAVGQVIEFPL